MAAEDRGGMAIGITCKDIATSVEFYRDKLGFEMKESWPSDDAPMWCNMVLGKQSVMLGAAMTPEQVGEMCAQDTEAAPHHQKAAERFQKHPAGIGLMTYLQVDDVDAFQLKIAGKDVAPLMPPKTQFYGIREMHVDDPDGYRLVFYHPVTMDQCQSCGMPLSDAEPGQMYCGYCTDESGKLRPYEQVFEGTVTGFFMGMQKMERADAEAAAKEHLAKMPAWGMHG